MGRLDYYRGPQVHNPRCLFVTPVPNAPFTADVDINSHQKLPDGTENIRTAINHIARDSSGRIYNERRVLCARLPSTANRAWLSAHIYDPATRPQYLLRPP